jgi:hypothetical protein
MAVVALIKEIPLFGPLQDGEIAILAALLRRRSIKKGDEGTTRLAKRLRELARGVLVQVAAAILPPLPWGLLRRNFPASWECPRKTSTRS